MSSTEPGVSAPDAWPAPTTSATGSAFSPALQTAGRVLATITGALAGLAMLAVGGLFALLTTCTDYDGETAVCGSLGALVGPLELVAVIGGATAAIAGGVATASTGRARWIAAGVATTIVLAFLLSFLVGVQRAALS